MNAKTIFGSLFWSIAVLNSVLILAYLTWFWGEFEDNAISTLCLYGPRWPYAIPAFLSAMTLLYLRKWKKAGSMLVLASTTVVVICGLNLSTQSVLEPPPAYARFRVMTWNAGGTNTVAEFRRFQLEIDADIVVIQESPPNIQQSDFPIGWHFMKAEGGLTVASRYHLEFVEGLNRNDLPLPGAAAKFRLDTPEGIILLCNVHLPTPRPGIQSAIKSKLRDLNTLEQVLTQTSQSSQIIRNWVGFNKEITIVAGDFNMPVETWTYRRDWSDFTNAFSKSTTGFGTTKQTSWHGVRIDHVLTGPALKCRNSFVGSDLGSDHLPMVADLMTED